MSKFNAYGHIWGLEFNPYVCFSKIQGEGHAKFDQNLIR